MKMRKALSLLLAGILGASILSGCGNKDVENENVTLKWIMAGQGMQQDSQKVWDKFNEELQSYLPGVTVEFEPVTFADFAEKWQLACAAGEEADIVWTGYTFRIPDQVRKGAYMELDELLNDYAPELKKEIPQWAWDLGSVDGKIYVMPILQQFCAGSGFMAPKALADEYLDYDAVAEKCFGQFGTNQESFDVFADYLEKLKGAGKIGKGVYATHIAQYRHAPENGIQWDSPTPLIFCNQNEDGTFNVMKDYDKPGVRLMYKNMADWYIKGYINPDILTMNDINSYVGKEDGIVLSHTQILEGEEERRTQQYGMDMKVIDLQGDDGYYIGVTSCTTGLAIPKTSKHPKEAIELIQLLNTEKGKDLLNLLVYGIEGEHYEFVGEDRIRTFDYAGTSPKSNSKYGVDKWSVGNTYYAYETTDVPDGWNDYIKEVNEKASSNPSPLLGFYFDAEPVKVEVAQLQALKSQYEPVLINGAMGTEWESYFNEYIEKLEIAGIDKVAEEVKRQLDEWTEQKKSK